MQNIPNAPHIHTALALTIAMIWLSLAIDYTFNAAVPILQVRRRCRRLYLLEKYGEERAIAGLLYQTIEGTEDLAVKIIAMVLITFWILPIALAIFTTPNHPYLIKEAMPFTLTTAIAWALAWTFLGRVHTNYRGW